MLPSMKSLQARAEDLFGDACTLRGYGVEKLLTRQDAKTPDFQIRFQGEELIAEVKSPGLEPQIEQLMGSSSGCLWLKPGKRVRDLIRDSEDQLAAWGSDVPKIVVICDMRHLLPGYPMYPLYGFNAGDMAAGMFGEIVFRYRFYDDRVVSNGPELGGSRTLRSNHYTHISAVALHLVGREFQLGPIRVYHNPFATHPLPPQWFQQPGDLHFGLAKENGEFVLRWEERRVM
jgi:hypothetical protein